MELREFSERFDVQIHLLRTLSRLIESNFSYDNLLELILESATLISGGNGSSLLLIDEKTGKLHFNIAVGKGSDEVKGFVLEQNEGIAGWIAKHKKPLYVEDVCNDKRWSGEISASVNQQVTSLAGVPLFVDGRIYGVMEVIFASPPQMPEKVVESLDAFAEMASGVIENFVNYGTIRNSYNQLKSTLLEKYRIIGHSAAIEEVMNIALKVAKTSSTVLIQGESGTGKELIARMLHENSPRRKKMFFAINCGAMPETIMERELFGHEKGAFTGADSIKVGLFEAADGSTLFFDEIGEMPKSMQVKLLRVLQGGSFMRLGSTKTITADVRIVAATNRDLKEEVKKGNFREDLYYRLNVIRINLPPLRERGEDIPVLINHFLEKYRKEMNIHHLQMSDAAMNILKQYSWPGNIRELENTIERAVVMRGGIEIMPEDLQLFVKEEDPLTSFPVGMSLKDAQEQFKRIFIEKTLESTGGNKTKAAKILDIERTYLSKICSQYQKNRDEEKK